MFRILAVVVGLAFAAAASQFPAFSQQYLQRLAGAVDELTRVVDDFDRSAVGVGLTRAQALEALDEGAFQQSRRADMTRTIARAERLSADLAVLREASVVERALKPQRFTDPEIAAAAWADFEPAVPVTATGAGFALVGFLFGAGLIAGLGLLLRRDPKERKPRKASRKPAPAQRVEPTLAGGRAPSSARPALPVGWLARTNRHPRKLVQSGQGVQVAVLSVPVGGEVTASGGQGFDLVLMCLEGQGKISCGADPDRQVAAEELVTLPPGSDYRITNLGDGPMRLLSVEPKKAEVKPSRLPSLRRG